MEQSAGPGDGWRRPAPAGSSRWRKSLALGFESPRGRRSTLLAEGAPDRWRLKSTRTAESAANGATEERWR
jgi:hypothetical protein